MKKDLKKIIKEIVRQCLKEVLAEQFIENAVKDVISEGFLKSSNPPSFKEAVLPKENNSNKPTLSENHRRTMLNKILENPDTNPYSSIFEDTLQSGNPILTETNDHEDDVDTNEHVPEEILARTGLLKDYSKFLKK